LSLETTAGEEIAFMTLLSAIVYLNVAGEEGYAFELLDPETGDRRRIADASAIFYCQGISVPPDGQWLIYALTDKGRESESSWLRTSADSTEKSPSV
jgi:hypothetical protein